MVITVAGEKCEVYRLKVSGMVRTFFREQRAKVHACMRPWRLPR